MTKEIFPQWVLVNGQIHRVSDFSNLAPPARPEAFCPLCMAPVILKLGNERVYHYAHQTKVTCAATQPETALHLNTKYYIYNQLLSGTELYLEQQCSNSCGKSRTVSWVGDWGEVKIEYQIGQFRPDIAILGKVDTVNAIEIKVTHQVEDDKEAFYKIRDIGWLEVVADESIYDGENPWKIDVPLPFAVCKPPLAEWTCESCSEQLRKEEEIKLREQREWEYRKHNYLEPIYSKIVDYYFPSGKKFRETYYLNRVIRVDKPIGVLVNTEHQETIFRKTGESLEALLNLAFRETKQAVDKRREYGAIVDDHKWLTWVHGNKYLARATDRYPYLYRWDNNVKKWVKPVTQYLAPSDDDGFY